MESSKTTKKLKYIYVFAWITVDSDIGYSIITTDTNNTSDAIKLLRQEWEENYGDMEEPEWECIHSYTQYHTY